MKNLSRIITGGLMIFFALWFIIFLGFVDGPGIDYLSIFAGIFLLAFGIIIALNKKEDEIERIKSKRKNE